MGIKTVRIQNFKSIKDSNDVFLKQINVLVGANGAGKSNFISFFKFLTKLYQQELQLYIAQNGRADNFLFFGRKTSQLLAARIVFESEKSNGYQFLMIPDQFGNLIFSDEFYINNESDRPDLKPFGIRGNSESAIKDTSSNENALLKEQLADIKLFHFHDTGFNSAPKQPCGIRDNAYLQEDGRNLAAILFKLQERSPSEFRMIEKVIKSVAPFFGGFYLQPDELNAEQIFLRWRETGYEQLFTAHNLSDGTLRMMCLATLLLQPETPGTIIIDEPELGLHPFAIAKLADLLKIASERSQIIISTQSVTLVNYFKADDIIVVERTADHETTFSRQSDELLVNWLQDYSLGELWEKNVLGGRPR